MVERQRASNTKCYSRRDPTLRCLREWTESLLLALGLALLAAYSAARIDQLLGARAAIRDFYILSAGEKVASQQVKERADSRTSLVLPTVNSQRWDKHRIAQYLQSTTMPLGAPVAVLRIPKIHLEAAVLDGTDSLTLNRAVGRIAGTARPGEQGNIGLAGHRDGFFRGLEDVVVGDQIELRSLKGTDRYIVDQIRIVMPNQTDVLAPSPIPSLTLVTCYPFHILGSAPKRYVVSASLEQRGQ